MRARSAVLVVLLPVLVAWPSASRAQSEQPPVVREEVEIREVGVVADVPSSLRGLSAAELGRRLVVLEDGVARAPMSVAPLRAPGRAIYSQVVVAFDTTHCDDDILKAGAAAVGSAAARLVALGPVDVVRAGERRETLLGGAGNEEAVAHAAAAVARGEGCPPARAKEGAVPPGLELGRCASAPCLLVWVGAGWGRDAAAVSKAAPALEERLRALSSGGWVVLSAPVARSERPKDGPTIPPPEHVPGTDRYTFGISIFGKKQAEALTPEEYDRAVDLWLAPLRRLAAATVGELATTGEELAVALDALAKRSILWYRAERVVNGALPRLEVREAGGEGRRLRAPEWGPALR